MKFIKRPSVIDAYIFGTHDEAIPYVKEGDMGFYVKNLQGIHIQVRKGDYVVPQSHATLVSPRAYAVNPKAFKDNYKEVEISDAEIIKDEE